MDHMAGASLQVQRTNGTTPFPAFTSLQTSFLVANSFYIISGLEKELQNSTFLLLLLLLTPTFIYTP